MQGPPAIRYSNALATRVCVSIPTRRGYLVFWEQGRRGRRLSAAPLKKLHPVSLSRSLVGWHSCELKNNKPLVEQYTYIMPALRVSTGRRATPARAGIYDVSRTVTFAPNVTPVSYVDDESSSNLLNPSEEPVSLENTLFPPSSMPAPPPARKRCPPGKRRSMGYIPRPPNAFMLFRADFVRQKHVPGSIETNHGSLSKIIGNCWRALPLEEKRVWELRAKHAKADHKIQYPEYKFRPVHNKNKDQMKKEKAPVTVEDERRCEEVAQLLLEGKKGEELAAAVRDLDAREGTPDAGAGLFLHHQHHHQHQHQQPLHRMSLSVPLPNDYSPAFSGITLPSVPFLPTSRAPSPVSPISRRLHQAAQYNHLGHRRSSAGVMLSPHFHQSRSWTMPIQADPLSHQRDHSPLPEVDTSLFNPSFQLESPQQQESPFNFTDLLAGLPPHGPLDPPAHGPLDPSLGHSVGPLEGLSPHVVLGPFPDAMDWLTPASEAYSEAPTPYEYEGTPAFARDDPSLFSSEGGSTRTTTSPYTPPNGNPPLPSHFDNAFSDPSTQPPVPVLHQPKPTTPTATAFSDMWKDVGGEVYAIASRSA
ncbi:hypothetical protein K443DRAFT_126060 [Laccaria amethystina LaAM-08-1]|uniref:HMG box domain-containing protein n=1 Tax=Laccaria amethystina LaAM-08-1 TaxID=1095629 RepID=A0A0C9WNL3_9AGAR|nr:hypothetical protein K443DRAFT_126060 [Laccaria amethystina LaAM-08-1]